MVRKLFNDSTGSVGSTRYNTVYYDDSFKTEAIIAVFFICLLFAGCSTLTVLVWPVTERNPCVKGDSLNGYEQIWCSPKHKASINATRTNGSSIALYRVKKANVSSKIARFAHIQNQFNVSTNNNIHYSFVLMQGSSVRAEMDSTDINDDWYLMDYDNLESYQNGDPFTSIKSSKGSLSVAFEATESDSYYFFVHHRHGKGVVSFDMQFKYLVFDLGSSISPSCNDQINCTFEDVGSDELIIADNSQSEEWSLHLDLPRKIDLIATVFLLTFLVITGIGTIGSVGFCMLSTYANCRSQQDYCFGEKSYLKGSSSSSLFYSGIDFSVDDRVTQPSTTPSFPSVNSDIPEPS